MASPCKLSPRCWQTTCRPGWFISVTRKCWEIQLVGGFFNLRKMMELVGMKFPTEWKHDKFMFQTIKQWEIHSSSGKASEILMTTARAWMGRLDLWQWVCAWSICCNTKIGTNAKPMAFGARKMSCKAGMIFHKRWMPGLQAYSRECCSLENCWKSKLVCRWCSGMFRGHFKQLGRTYHTWAQFLKPLGREFPPKTWHDTLGRPFHILWLQDRG